VNSPPGRGLGVGRESGKSIGFRNPPLTPPKRGISRLRRHRVLKNPYLSVLEEEGLCYISA
jgi:hypothetical protein